MRRAAVCFVKLLRFFVIMKNIEQELKMRLDEREYNILLQASDARPALQTNFYFLSDDPDPDVMVRIRQKGSSFLLCYKRRLSQNDGISVCDERECGIMLADARRMLDDGLRRYEINGKLGLNLQDDFRYKGKLDTYRAKFLLDEWVLELDKNEYLGVTDYELECECSRVDALVKLKSYLQYHYGVVYKPSLPKSERFFAELQNKK